MSRVLRMVAVVGLASGLLMHAGPDAIACTCETFVGTVPTDASDNVPLNARIIITNDFYGDLTLWTATASVPVTVEEHPAGPYRVMKELRPETNLLPSTSYTVRSDGDVVLTFATSDSTDTVPPALAISQFEIHQAEYEAGDTCADGLVNVDLELQSTGEEAYYKLDFEPDPLGGNSSPFFVLAEDLPQLGTPGEVGCPLPLLFAASEICVSVTPVDVVGNLGQPVVACTVPLACDALPGPPATGPLENCVSVLDQGSGGCGAGKVTGASSAALLMIMAMLLLRQNHVRRRRDAEAMGRRRS